ncbi:hypothetical protein Esti_003614 [Eimeria stiedai]
MVCESSGDVLLVSSVASLLQQLASQNKSTGCGAPCFLSATEPMISVADYVERLARFFQCSRECFVLALLYIDRLLQSNSQVWLCPLNVHRLVVTALMVAVKFADDTFYSNAYYAKVGGLPVKEINYLEATLLRMLRFRLHVLPCEFERFYRLVMASSAAAAARPRAINSSNASNEVSSSCHAASKQPHFGAAAAEGEERCTSSTSPAGSSQSVSPPCTPQAADDMRFPSANTAVSSSSRCCADMQRTEEGSSKWCRHPAAAEASLNARLQGHVHQSLEVGIGNETACPASLTRQDLIGFSAAPSRSVEQVDARGSRTGHF